MKKKILTTQIAAICIIMMVTSFNFATADDTLHWTPDRDVWDFELAYDDHRHSYKPYYGRVDEATGVINGCHLQKDESINRLYSLSVEKYTTIDVNNRLGMYTKIWDSGWTDACRYQMAGVDSQVGIILSSQSSTLGTTPSDGIKTVETMINKNGLVSNAVHTLSNKPAHGNTKGSNLNTKLYSKMHSKTLPSSNQPLQFSKSINRQMQVGTVVGHPGLEFPGLGRESIPPILNKPIHVSMMGPKFNEQGLYRATLYIHNLDTSQVTAYPTTFSTRNVTVALLGDSYASGEGNPDNPAEWDSTTDRILTNPIRAFDPNEYNKQCSLIKLNNNNLTNVLEYNYDPVEVLAKYGKKEYSPFIEMRNIPEWLDLSAHRSLRSGHSLAAMDFSSWLNQEFGNTMTFFNFSSSGAKTTHVMHEAQYFYHRQLSSGRPNIYNSDGKCLTCGQIRDLVDTVQGNKIDILILSIGGNDVGFSKAVESALSNGNFTDSIFQDLKTELEKSYEELNDKISKTLDVDHVILTGYPTDLFSTSSNTSSAGCGIFETSFGWTGKVSDITKKEVDELKQWGIELEELQAHIAKEYGWSFVDVSDEFLSHGYCGKLITPYVFGESPYEDGTTYFRGAGRSCKMQGDILGALHPNEKGHEVYRSKVLAELKKYYLNRTRKSIVNVSKSKTHM